MNKFILTLSMLLISVASMAQDDSIEMADGLFQSGKIYIVVISVLIVLVGLLLYLIGLDKKIGKLEAKLNENKQ